MKDRAVSILRRSEAFFKADMVYLAKGGSWMSFGQGINMALGFLVSLAFANFFPKESFGTYKFVLSTVALIGVFSFIDMGTAVTQAVARGFGNSLRQGFRANLKWSIGTILAGLVLSVYYYVNGNALLSLSFLLAGILTPVAASAGLYGAYLLGKKDFKRSTLYGVIRNVVPAVALIITIFLTQSLLILIAVYFVSTALVSLFLYYATRSAYRGENEKEEPGLVSYAGHLGVMGVIGQVAGNLDKILVFHYLGAVPLAVYAFAIAPVEQLQSGKKILNALMLPKLSGRSFTDLQKSAPRRIWMLAAYAAVLVGIYIPLIPYFYKFFYPQYIESVFYSQVYSLTLFGIVGSVLDSHLVAHRKKRELYLSRTVIPITTIILYFVLIPSFGLMGLVVAQITVRVFSGLLSYYLVTYPFKSETH
ncbi:MAG: oligosaccharide flippase family protein [Patescibacteria group bacterium]|nr:oligosaccharide flippase family protein [Patescibacteria group bacterium]